jgi:hypothetical protein
MVKIMVPPALTELCDESRLAQAISIRSGAVSTVEITKL